MKKQTYKLTFNKKKQGDRHNNKQMDTKTNC